jgi:signal transduction histidine kinase
MSQVEAGDLTARVAGDYQDELGRLGGSFNAMVARLADARRQLEDRHAEEIRRAEHLASLGKLAAGIAHEINNPIAGMQNCVRTLLKGVRDEPRQVQYLTMVQDGLGRIGRTVGQLLDFAREAKPQFSPTQIHPLLQRCMALLEQDAVVRQVRLNLSRNAPLPALLVDRLQIEQVFLNILKNSIEAMPGGGTVTIRAFQRPARSGQPAAGVGAGEPGRRGAEESLPLHRGPPAPPQFVVVEVSDTGEGIPPEHVPRIFDPFFTTKEVGKGTGLGLSVSYGIVRAHGGFIEVQSEVAKGSTFTVALPVKRDEGE